MEKLQQFLFFVCIDKIPLTLSVTPWSDTVMLHLFLCVWVASQPDSSVVNHPDRGTTTPPHTENGV